MQKIEFESGGRSMRWYEWLAGLLLFGVAVGARAGAVYKCIDAQGAITYQQVACGAEQRQSPIAILPPPRYAPSPHYAVERREEPAARSPHAPHDPVSQETAFECRASDGRVFYRLGTCPHSITANPSAAAAAHRGKNGAAHGSKNGGVQVAARRIPREQACREMHRAGAIGRDGHEFDEHISTYERDLGHDPCK